MACSKGLRVLVVDDDPIVRERLAFHLREWGHEATQAASVRSAVRTMERARPDVVISDVVLPGSSGLVLLRRVKAEIGHLPVVLISAHVGPDHAAEAMREGADDLLAKPLDIGEVRELLDAAHDRLHATERPHADIAEGTPEPGG